MRQYLSVVLLACLVVTVGCGRGVDACPEIPKAIVHDRCGGKVIEHEGRFYAPRSTFSRYRDTVEQDEIQGCVELAPGYHQDGDCYFRVIGAKLYPDFVSDRGPLCDPFNPC